MSSIERRKYLHLENPWPRFLYKFRDTRQEDRLRSLIVRSQVFLSSPRDFNDPFDTRGKLVIRGGIDALIRKFKSFPMDKKTLRTASRDARNGVEVEGLEGYVSRMFRPSENFDELMGEQGVHCFASRTRGERRSGPRSNLMWSHYGDSHKGLCLQYAVHEDPVLVQALKVNYASEYPLVNWLSDSFRNDIVNCIWQKDECWKYEGEWRYVQPQSARKLISLRKRALKSVILGAESTRSSIDLIRQLAQERESVSGVKTDLYKAERSTDRYQLTFRRLR